MESQSESKSASVAKPLGAIILEKTALTFARASATAVSTAGLSECIKIFDSIIAASSRLRQFSAPRFLSSNMNDAPLCGSGVSSGCDIEMVS